MHCNHQVQRLFRVKKIVSNPRDAPRSEDCVDLRHVAKFVRLNAAALSDPDSLFITLMISALLLIKALIDSRSSHCFIDPKFVKRHKLPMTTIPPIGLHLFDGTCNSIITQTMELPVTFPTGEVLTLTFYVTPLNSSCSVVLGYNWLKQYNPLVDWKSGHICSSGVGGA